MSTETMLKTTASTKPCTKCGELRPLTEFYTDKRARDGKKSNCKTCHNTYSRNWAKENEERTREISLKSYYRHHDARIKSMAAWKRAHPEKMFAHSALRQIRRSQRVVRIEKLIDHFEGRPFWLWALSEIVAFRPDCAGLCWSSQKIDELLLYYHYEEEV